MSSDRGVFKRETLSTYFYLILSSAIVPEITINEYCRYEMEEARREGGGREVEY